MPGLPHTALYQALNRAFPRKSGNFYKNKADYNSTFTYGCGSWALPTRRKKATEIGYLGRVIGKIRRSGQTYKSDLSMKELTSTK